MSEDSMICRILFLFTVIFSALFHLTVYGNESVRLDVQFPYSLNGEKHKVIPAGSTQILFLNIESIDLPKEETANIKVTLPGDFSLAKAILATHSVLDAHTAIQGRRPMRIGHGYDIHIGHHFFFKLYTFSIGKKLITNLFYMTKVFL